MLLQYIRNSTFVRPALTTTLTISAPSLFNLSSYKIPPLYKFSLNINPTKSRTMTIATQYKRTDRPNIVGADDIAAPYPLFSSTQVVAGFGRGSSDLGIPTANIPPASYQPILDATSEIEGDTGIYYGWAAVYPSSRTVAEVSKTASEASVPCDRVVDYNYGQLLTDGEDKAVVFPMVMSVGWNPFYGNKQRSAEIHIIHKYAHTFYGADIRFVVLGYIRPELDYVSKGNKTEIFLCMFKF